MGLSPHSDARCNCHNNNDPRQLYLWLPATGSEETSWRELGLSPTGIAPTEIASNEIAPNGILSHCNLLPMNLFQWNLLPMNSIPMKSYQMDCNLDPNGTGQVRTKRRDECFGRDSQVKHLSGFAPRGLPDKTHLRNRQCDLYRNLRGAY